MYVDTQVRVLSATTRPVLQLLLVLRLPRLLHLRGAPLVVGLSLNTKELPPHILDELQHLDPVVVAVVVAVGERVLEAKHDIEHARQRELHRARKDAGERDRFRLVGEPHVVYACAIMSIDVVGQGRGREKREGYEDGRRGEKWVSEDERVCGQGWGSIRVLCITHGLQQNSHADNGART